MTKRQSIARTRGYEIGFNQGKTVGDMAGYERAKRDADIETAKRKEAHRLEEDRLRSQSIDAICHAITALARLIDGREDGR